MSKAYKKYLYIQLINIMHKTSQKWNTTTSAELYLTNISF